MNGITKELGDYWARFLQEMVWGEHQRRVPAKMPFASADEPLTHAKITLPIKLRSGMITNNNEEIAQSSKPRSGMESNNNEVGSDNDSEATLTDYNSDSEWNTSSDGSSDNDTSYEEI